MDAPASSSSTEAPGGAPPAEHPLGAEALRRGWRALAILAGLALLIALAASFEFASGRHDSYPYSWF